MGKVAYFVSAPNSVEKVAEEFRKKLKSMKDFLDYRHLYKLENVNTIKECKFALVFCPIVSRTGTDIDAKRNEIETDFKDKSVILIVLHHTFDPESIVSDSRKFVPNDEMCTLDVLFHEDKGLLKCEKNSKALKEASDWIKLEIKNLQCTKSSKNKKGTNKTSKK